MSASDFVRATKDELSGWGAVTKAHFVWGDTALWLFCSLGFVVLFQVSEFVVEFEIWFSCVVLHFSGIFIIQRLLMYFLFSSKVMAVISPVGCTFGTRRT